MNRTGPCVCCGEEGRIQGRGLIDRCYSREQYHGTLADWPRRTRSAEEFVADYQLLRSEGYTRRQIAERLDYPLESMLRQIYRLRRRRLLTPAGGAW